MKKYGMTVGDIKEALKDVSDETEIYIANSFDVLGNISELCEVREDTYGCFGKSIPCIILGSAHNTTFEEDED